MPALPAVKKQLLIGGSAALVIVLAIGAIIIYRQVTRPVIPLSIQKDAASAVIVPEDKAVSIDQKTVKYNSQEQAISFVADFTGAKITVTEQAAPETFTDVSGYYAKWLSSLGEYDSVSTSLDTVYLAQSKSLGQYPIAVVATKGTLLFARPDENLSQTQWRQFFDTMTVLR